MLLRRKIYSEIDINELEELQREFARKDYEGLNKAEAAELRKIRGQYAKQLKKSYRDSMNSIDKNTSGKIETVGTHTTKKGYGKNLKVITEKLADEDLKDFKNRHKKVVRDNYLDTKDLKEAMKKGAKENVKSGNANSKVKVVTDFVKKHTPKSTAGKVAAGTALVAVPTAAGVIAYNHNKRKSNLEE